MEQKLKLSNRSKTGRKWFRLQNNVNKIENKNKCVGDSNWNHFQIQYYKKDLELNKQYQMRNWKYFSTFSKFGFLKIIMKFLIISLCVVTIY